MPNLTSVNNYPVQGPSGRIFFNPVKTWDMLTLSSRTLLALISSCGFICNMPSGIHLSASNLLAGQQPDMSRTACI